MVHYHLLLVHWISLWSTTILYLRTDPPLGTLLSSTGPLVISIVHYYLLLSHHWLSLWYTTIFYWSIGFIYDTPLYILTHYYFLLAHWSSLCYSTIFYWQACSLYGTLPSSPSPVAPCVTYVTLPFSTGPLAVPMVHYHLLLAQWISLWNTTIFYWPTGPL